MNVVHFGNNVKEKEYMNTKIKKQMLKIKKLIKTIGKVNQ